MRTLTNRASLILFNSMTKKAIIITSVIAAGTGAGVFFVYKYYSNQVDGFKKMTYKLKSFQLGNYTAEQATVNMVLQIYNPTTFDAEVKDLYLDIKVNGQKLGYVQDNMPFTVLAKGYSPDINLNLTFSPKLLLGDIADLALAYLGSKDFTINLNGFIRVKSAFISLSVPFDYTTSLKQIMLP